MITHKTTKAEEVYSTAYSQLEEQFGIPDRKIICDMPEEDLTILSLGSGDCADIWFLADKNNIYALDGSPAAIKKAAAHNINGLVCNLEEKLPFPDKMFDLVVCKDLLEHLLNPESLLKEINRVIKPDGKLIVSVPNHFYLFFRLRLLFGGNLIWKSLMHNHSIYYEEWNYMHIRFFTFNGFKHFIQLGGFAIERPFWDFGVLAHYSSPDLYYDHFKEKFKNKPLTHKAKIFKFVLLPIWYAFNFVFPRKLRHFLVSLSPGLLCAGFYLRCIKLKNTHTKT